MAAKATNKKITLIANVKGGVGKSILTYLLALKHPDTVILDMDSENAVTTKQLAYRKPKFIDFKNDKGVIDRGIFSRLLEDMKNSEGTNFIGDLGASESGQLIDFINDYGADNIKEMLVEMEVSLEIICVVGGSGQFKSTAEYLNKLLDVTKDFIPVKVAYNSYFRFIETQEEIFKAILKKHNKDFFAFTIAGNGQENDKERIVSVLNAGQGIEAAPIASRFLFNKSIKDLAL